MIKSQQRFQFTLQGVRREANIGMTIHTLVLISDRFSCIVILFILQCQLYFKSNLILSLLLLCVYINYCISMHIHFSSSTYSNVTTSTRINSSSVDMYICVCFIRNQYNTYQVFNKGLLNPIFNTLFNSE